VSYNILVKKSRAVITSLCIVFVCSLAAIAAEPGLVLHLDFEEVQETTVRDLSGNRNHGTIRGGAKQAEGRIGKGLEFDGEDDYVICGQRESLNLSQSDFTIMVWVKEAGNRRASPRGIVSKAAKAGKGYLLGKTRGNSFRLAIGDGKIHYLSSDKQYTDSDWHHLAAVRKGGTNYLYVDGIQQTRTTSDKIVDSRGRLVLGRFYGDKDGLYFMGVIDEVKIYNRAFSAEEIDKDFRTVSVTEKSNLCVVSRREHPGDEPEQSMERVHGDGQPGRMKEIPLPRRGQRQERHQTKSINIFQFRPS